MIDEEKATMQVISDAEAIWLGWKNGDWEIDSEKATEIMITPFTVDLDKRKKKEHKDETTNLTLAVANTLSNYPVHRAGSRWLEQARELILTYNAARAYGVIRLSEGYMGKFANMQEQLRTLKQTIEDLSSERDGYKKRWEDCENANRKGTTETSSVESP